MEIHKKAQKKKLHKIKGKNGLQRIFLYLKKKKSKFAEVEKGEHFPLNCVMKEMFILSTKSFQRYFYWIFPPFFSMSVGKFLRIIFESN
jgi:hypothetical protein